MKILLEEVYKKIVNFLKKEKYEYMVIGGIAAGILGEPRLTADVDIDILLDKDQITDFLKKVKKAGFKFNAERCRRTTVTTGTFQINYGDFHIDFIIASTEFEKEAFQRHKVVRLYNTEGFFPTPEDMILLKIIPARPQDLLDAERIVTRYRNRLDTRYLENWAKRLSDEAQDLRIFNELQKLLEVKK